MSRPKVPRRIRSRPCCSCYKPECSLKKDLLGVTLQSDEFEALKLYDVDGLSQNAASERMNVSQSTFARILASVHKKIAGAIVGGGEIKIN